MPGKDRESERDESYGRHARDVTGRHLAGACPECARVEELGRSASQLEKNCTALFEALRALHNKHGGCGCLECGAARFLIRVVERFGVEIGEPEAGPGAASADLGPDPRFEKIVSPNGYPVAQFYTRVMSTETPDPNRFLL